MSIGVVIPCHRPRLQDLKECLDAFYAPDGRYRVVVVTTLPDTIYHDDLYDFPGVRVVSTGSDEINLAKWYNLGFDYWMNGHWEFSRITGVMWMETDVRITPPNIDALYDAMIEHDLDLVGPDLFGLLRPDEVLIRREVQPLDHRERLCQVHLAPATSTHRMDERFDWWFESSDLEYKARVAKGTGLVGASRADHTPTYYNDMVKGNRPDLVEKANRGRELFTKKWGHAPI